MTGRTRNTYTKLINFLGFSSLRLRFTSVRFDHLSAFSVETDIGNKTPEKEMERREEERDEVYGWNELANEEGEY
jgi:hypothetical protein